MFKLNTQQVNEYNEINTDIEIHCVIDVFIICKPVMGFGSTLLFVFFEWIGNLLCYTGQTVFFMIFFFEVDEIE